MKNLFGRMGRSFHTRTGSYIFFALAALAAACLHSSKWAYGWIAELYPLGDNFIPALFCAIGAAALFNIIFLLGAEKFGKNHILRIIHTLFCVLTGIFCGYTLFLMLGIDSGLANAAKNIGNIFPDLPYLGVAAGLPFVFLIFPKMKKTPQAICAVLISAAIILPITAGFIPTPFAFSTSPLVLDIGGDRYSVVFATNRASVGILDYVDAAGDIISVTDDSYGRSNTGRIHSVTVLRDALNGGKYSVRAIEIKLSADANTTFGAEIKSAEYNFYGEYKDALNILIASDMHDQPEKLLAAAANFPQPDLFLMLGDFSSNYNSEDNLIDSVIAAGADVTKSAIPAIFARGNHEMFGQMPDILYDSLGLDGFYYQVQRGKYLFTVADGAADWDSDFNPNGKGSVRDSAQYREEQLAWLEALPVPATNTFHFALCHIPEFEYGDAVRQERFINGLIRLETDAQFSGHTHTLEYRENQGSRPYPLLIDGGPTNNYSGNYICSMAEVSANGKTRLTSYTNTGEQKLDKTLTIE